MEDQGLLLSLPDELLLKVLLAAGAPAVARATTLCRRLQAAQAQLTALPAFASGASITEHELADNVVSACMEAREQMPAGVDFALIFVAGSMRGRGLEASALEEVVPQCQALLPPGTLVVGCCGRGLFGVEGGVPRELDPGTKSSSRAASVLLGRLPGCSVRTFAAAGPPTDGWASRESCLDWLGLGTSSGSGAGSTGQGGAPGQQQQQQQPPLEPVSCLLFAHPSAGSHLHQCLDGLHTALPHMLLTGGVASGMAKLFCSQPLPPPAAAEDAAGAAADEGGSSGGPRRSGRQQQRGAVPSEPKYVGLLICQKAAASDGGSSSRVRAGGLSAQGLLGGEPLLSRLTVIRGFGLLQHASNQGPSHDTELVGLTGAHTRQGRDGMRALAALAANQDELGVWAGSSADPGSFDAAVAAGQPAVVLQLYGVVEQGETLAAANDDPALAAVMAAAEGEGRTLCAQPLKLSSQGAKEALRSGVAELAAGRPTCHPLLPTANMGLAVVCCTAKGSQMHGVGSVEAEITHTSSRQMPFAGVYCDGEIGPAIRNGKSTVQWAGGPPGAQSQPTDQPPAGVASPDAPGGEGAARANSGPPCGKLHGFTTIVTALSGML